jgi:hypothetical protein
MSPGDGLMDRRPTAALLAAALVWTSTGCSLLYVKGPQPDVNPPPPCTTSNALPVEDLILTGSAVVVLATGAIIHANETEETIDHGKGAGLMVAGGIGALLFGTSAIVGYGRTSDCRAWLESEARNAAPPAAQTPSSFLVPARRCPTEGDAPRLCQAEATWESGAVVLGKARAQEAGP